MGFLKPSGGGAAAVPPPPPPPPNPPTYANPQVQNAGAAAQRAAAAAAGAGFSGTLTGSPQGSAAAPTATKQLLGQSISFLFVALSAIGWA